MPKEMNYSKLAQVYDSLNATTKRLEKEAILAEFFTELKDTDRYEWIYLLKGRVFPEYDERVLGVSNQIAIKAITFAFGLKEDELIKRYKKIGDLGELAQEFAGKRKQSSLFTKKLTVGKVFENLRKIFDIEGNGSIKRKIDLIAELLGSANEIESKYIIRTILGQLRIGVADGTIRDGITLATFPDEKAEMAPKIMLAYDIANDLAEVFRAAVKGKKELEKIDITPGRPINAMLPVKVTDIKEAFRICGKPAAIEHKYDGFRVLINKSKDGIKLFTRRLENVTNQFPDVVEVVKKNIKGKEFVLDSEVVGFNPKNGHQLPFEAISQRIRRKYEIERLIKELPVEINAFDIIYHDGKILMNTPFKERRKLLEKVVKVEPQKIRVSTQIITSDEKEAMNFYKSALKTGEEGIMIKNLDAPYQQGRRVGFIVKLKPMAADLDLVITGAEYGSGKRGSWLTSYIVSCAKDGEFVEVGKVSSGLKELDQEGGTTYDEMTKLLSPLITSEKGKTVSVQPKIIVSVTYQNIQPSPSYSSGFAMRFPTITSYRPDFNIKDIATIEDIKTEVKRMQKNMSHLG